MPVKKKELDPVVANMKNVSEMFCEVLKIIDVKDVKVIDQLEGEERRDFSKFCHELFHSPHFSLIAKNFVFAQLMLLTEKGWDQTAYSNGQMAVNGVQMFRELVWRYSNIWDSEYSAPREDFDPYRSIPQGRL